MKMSRLLAGISCGCLFLCGIGFLGCGLVHGQGAVSAAPAPPLGHTFFRVQAPAAATGRLSGRLLIFLKQGSGDKEVNANEFHVEDTWVAAKEIVSVAPGETIEVDADDIAYPKPFSQIPAGKYEAQAVLDIDHSYNYRGRGPQDWMSAVVSLADWTPGSKNEPLFVLDQHPSSDLKRSAGRVALTAKAKLVGAEEEELVSSLLSRFWGHEVKIKAWVFPPPGYADHKNQTYPTAYWTHGFGGGLDSALYNGTKIYDRMKDGKMPPMFWVMLDESVPQGTHEFADSVNNGPWGTALTTEFIPYLERKYRMDARTDGRFLNGHSSGGWATLQLEVNYPNVFGGTWSTSPDSSDFHDFTGPDLYAANANMYRKPDGSAWPIVRDKGKAVVSMQQLAQLENVIGPYGGQFASFDWVFSPRGQNGEPVPMFDRKTGNVDSAVVAYWRDHYDLAHITEATWAERGPLLKGRIHLYVGTADTFYLDGAAHKFEAVLNQLGGEPHFTYVPDATHFTVYKLGSDIDGLFDQIGSQMYAVARPGADWKKEK